MTLEAEQTHVCVENVEVSLEQSTAIVWIDLYMDFGGIGNGIGYMETQFALNKIPFCVQVPRRDALS